MTTTTGNFHNQYTFTIVDHNGGYNAQLPLIQTNAIAVINYLSDFISWNGTLDFYVRFGSPFMNGHNGTGLLPAYGGVAPGGNTYAASEAFTGVDANGSDGDAGAWILPNANGTLTNYGVPLSFDPSPDPYEIHSPPAGTHDFFSIYLHEVLHGFGFWSLAQHGPTFGKSTFDTHTQQNNGVFEFVGAHVQALLGQNLQLAQTGSRDHYGGVAQNLPSYPFVNRGLMFEFGNYDQNRWHLGQLDLAVLADLGWTTANALGLSAVELPDNNPNLTGNDNANNLFGDHQQNTLNGLDGNDSLYGNAGNDIINGGNGSDTLTGGAETDTFQSAMLGLSTDTITDLALGEKIVFTDGGSNFTFSRNGTTLSYGNGSLQFSLTLSNNPAGQFVQSAHQGGGVELTFGESSFTSLARGRSVNTDFNADGRSDVLWQHNNGQVYEWDLNGRSVIGGGIIGNNTDPAWRVVGTGDFNADGRSDVLWQHNNGQVYEWDLNGRSVIGGGIIGNNTDPAWHVIATGDFNNDGRSDILWQHNNGQVYEWDLNGRSVIGGGIIGNNTDPAWHVVGTGDFNADGRSDILWQHNNGQVYEWDLNGRSVIGGGLIGNNTDSAWDVIG